MLLCLQPFIRVRRTVFVIKTGFLQWIALERSGGLDLLRP